jgi:predicted permease
MVSLERAAAIGSVVLPVFACAGLGWLWTRSGRPYDRVGVSELVTSLGAPALVFHSLVTLAVDPRELLLMGAATASSVALCALLGRLTLAALGLPANTYLPPLVFGNCGNLGLAVCALAFPAAAGGAPLGLTLAIGYFAVATVLQFTLGVAIWTGRWSLAELARSPLAWAALAASAVLLFDLELPRWLLSTSELLGGLAIPLMLLMLGASLGQLDLGRARRALGLSALRLGLGLVVGVAVAWLFALEGALRGVLILQSAMPAAVFNWLLAERYQRAPEDIASVVVLSTLLSLPFLPLLLAFVL